MSFEQEKMIVESLPSLYPLQKFEEEAINALVSLQIDDDTISRKEAIKEVSRNIPVKNWKDVARVVELMKIFADRIKQLPPVQPEIIRCKDCKHYKEWESEFTPNAVVTQCMADNFPIRKAIPDGWFCAGAERRTDG